MKAEINLITVITGNVPAMLAFYRDVLGFGILNDSGEYVELASPGVRFAICARSIMAAATGHPDYDRPSSGQRLELAFPCDSPAEVDEAYRRITAGGGQPVKEPADMPWNQRAAFFADPDGNIHEVFAALG